MSQLELVALVDVGLTRTTTVVVFVVVVGPRTLLLFESGTLWGCAFFHVL